MIRAVSPGGPGAVRPPARPVALPTASPEAVAPPAVRELTGREVAAAVFAESGDERVGWRTTLPGDDAGWPRVSPQGHLILSDGDGVMRVERDGRVAWRREREEWTHARPTPTPDGGAVWAPGKGGLVAYDAAGERKWRWGEGLPMQTIHPAVGPDGTTYVCVKDQGYRLEAVGPDGLTRWRAGLSMHASSPPLLHPDGKVSVRVDDYDDPRVATFSSEGKKLSEASVPGRVEGRLGLGPDGSVWLGNADGALFRIAPGSNSSQKVFQAVGAIRGAPRVESDGRVLFTTMKGFVHCLRPDGTEEWQRRLGGILSSQVERMADGTLLVPSFDRKLHALSPTGEPLWEMPLAFAGDDALAVGPDGSVFLAGRSEVVALRVGGVAEDLRRAVQAPAPVIETVGDEWILVGDVPLPVHR